MKPHIALIQCVLIVLAVSGALVSPRVIYTTGEREYDRSGFISEDRLAQWYPPIQGANAADDYLRAIRGVLSSNELFSYPELVYVELPVSGHPWSTEQTAMARKLITMAQPVLDHLDHAMQIDACRFPARLEKDGRLSLNGHHVGLRHCARLLTVVAIVEAHDGRVDQAVRRVEQIGRLADIVAEEPDSIAIAVSCGFRQRACVLAQWLIRTYPLSGDELALIERSLPEQVNLPRWYIEERIENSASPGLRRIVRKTGVQAAALRTLLAHTELRLKR